MYNWYITHLNNNNGTVTLESRAFQLARKSLRNDFKLRQKTIQDRFIEEENSINIWSKYPKLAAFLESKIQNRFKKVFMSEMHKEVEMLKELEIVHENRMQKLFEKNRENAKARLKYTLQETNPEANRIADALKLELKSIIAEAEDITNFYEVIINEDIDNTNRNKELIKQNFDSLIIQSWNEIIELLNKVPHFKTEILKQITKYEFKKKMVINRFHYLDNDYLPKNSMENQAKNYVKNLISLYGHDQGKKDSQENEDKIKNQKEKSVASQIIMICLLFISIVLLMTLSLLLYRFHGKINSYISNTFKKIHPPTKNLFVQIENYPFKNRYNYGNGIYRPYFKSEESIIGNPNSVYNQHFSSVTNSSNDVLKKSVESDYKESIISNINGLENPICRLLDEK